MKLLPVVLFFLTGCLFLVGLGVWNSSDSVSDAVEVPFTYPDLSLNVERGVSQLCASIPIIPSITLSKDRAFIKAVEDSSSFNVDTMLSKIRIWKSAAMGSPKILCVTSMLFQHYDFSSNQYQLWGKKCDHFFVFGNTSIPPQGIPADSAVEIHPPYGDGDKNVWQKSRTMYKYLTNWPRLAEFQFILFTGDDAFIIVENLRKMLLEPHTQMLNSLAVPLVLGHRMTTDANLPFLSGAAYVVNMHAFKILAAISNDPACHPDHLTEGEDVVIAECLNSFGIVPLSTFDSKGDDRFCIFNPPSWHGVVANQGQKWWFTNYRRRPMPRTFHAVSEYQVTFDFLNVDESKKLHKQLYK